MKREFQSISTKVAEYESSGAEVLLITSKRRPGRLVGEAHFGEMRMPSEQELAGTGTVQLQIKSRQGNAMDMIVRVAQRADLPRLTEIYNYYVSHTAVTFDIEEYTV